MSSASELAARLAAAKAVLADMQSSDDDSSDERSDREQQPKHEAIVKQEALLPTPAPVPTPVPTTSPSSLKLKLSLSRPAPSPPQPQPSTHVAEQPIEQPQPVVAVVVEGRPKRTRTRPVAETETEQAPPSKRSRSRKRRASDQADSSRTSASAAAAAATSALDVPASADPGDPGAGVDTFEWLQCDAPECGKWRKVPTLRGGGFPQADLRFAPLTAVGGARPRALPSFLSPHPLLLSDLSSGSFFCWMSPDLPFARCTAEEEPTGADEVTVDDDASGEAVAAPDEQQPEQMEG